MKITVVCEHNPSMDSEEGRLAYPEGLGNCLCDLLRETGADVTLVRADETGAALSDEVLGGTDVLFWWGHWYHSQVDDALVEKVAARVHGGMGMVFLHSAHESKMFKKLLRTFGKQS